MEEQKQEFKPKYVAVYNEESAQKLKNMIPEDINIEILSGMEGLKTISSLPEIDVLLTAIVGMIGLVPTLEAIKHKKDIALANKESAFNFFIIIYPGSHVQLLLHYECPQIPPSLDHRLFQYKPNTQYYPLAL